MQRLFVARFVLRVGILICQSAISENQQFHLKQIPLISTVSIFIHKPYNKLEILGFGHGGEDGMIGRLAASGKESEHPA